VAVTPVLLAVEEISTISRNCKSKKLKENHMLNQIKSIFGILKVPVKKREISLCGCFL